MPITIAYTEAGAGVVLTGSGTVTGDELVAANREIFSRDLAARPYRYVLFDANGMSGVEVTTMALGETAEQGILASRRMPAVVCAIYANSDLAYGLARMWEAFVQQSGWKTRAFRSRSEAVAWMKEEVAREFGFQITLP